MSVVVDSTGKDVYFPNKATEGSSGYDLASCESVTVPYGQTVLVSTGLKMAIPYGLTGQIFPRSGLSRKGIFVSVGTIDSDYRGVIKVIVTNGSSKHDNFHIVPGTRIAQIVFLPLANVSLGNGEVFEGDTERGSCGFGSTGLASPELNSQ